MDQDLRADDPAIKAALNRHRFVFADDGTAIAARSEIDEHASAAVLQNEFVAEDLGDIAFRRSRLIVLQLRDRRWLQQHDALRLPALGELRSAGPGGCADDEHGERDTAEHYLAVGAFRPRQILLVS
jgi:hypothetical protein